MDAGYKKWVNKGLVYIAQLFKGQTMKSYEQLAKEFNLPAHDFYKFVQLRHYLQNHEEWRYICKMPSKLEENVNVVYRRDKKRDNFKNIQRTRDHFTDNNSDIKEKWELEANIIISEETWEEALRAGHK